jgi:hypothetical protein
VGLRLAGEPGKQSQKVHRRHRNSPIQFLAQPHRQRTGEISPTAYFPDPLAARSQRHHTDQLDGKWTYTLIGGTSSSPSATTKNKMLIVATIKPKQFTLAIRNELAVSVVMENSQLVVIQLDLTPIGS